MKKLLRDSVPLIYKVVTANCIVFSKLQLEMNGYEDISGSLITILCSPYAGYVSRESACSVIYRSAPGISKADIASSYEI